MPLSNIIVPLLDQSRLGERHPAATVEVTQGEIRSIAQALAGVPDPRQARGRRHDGFGLLMAVMSAVLGGARTTVVADLPAGWASWLAGAGVEVGTPFLLSPLLEYDVTLNGFFQQLVMAGAAKTTQAGYARDLAAFLSFLWSARERRSWRDTTKADPAPPLTGFGSERLVMVVAPTTAARDKIRE